MSNIISLRRPIKVGDRILLRRLEDGIRCGNITYTVSRIEHHRLFGYQSNDMRIERLITNDYTTPPTITYDNESWTIGVTHLDGKRIE